MDSEFWTIAILGMMLIAALVLLRAVFLPANFAVTSRQSLLNDDERRLYLALQVWSGDRWTIFCKVALVDIISAKASAKYRRSWYQS